MCRWLSNYGSFDTRHGYSYLLYRYVCWLRSVKDANLTPSKLVELNLKNIYESKPVDTATKRLHTDWLMEFINTQARDEKGQWTRSGKWIKGIVTAARTFYEANDAPLQGKMRVPQPVLYRKKTKSMTIEQARRLIAVLPFRTKVIAILQMKSGMRIGDVLHLKWSDLKEKYERKQLPLKVDLINDHGKEYYTYIDAEGVEYMRQYLAYREKLVGRKIQEDEYIFIAEYAAPEPRLRPIDRDSVVRQFYETAKSKGLVTNNDNGMKSHKSEFKSHGFRHIFKTEAVRAGAELGIPRIDILIEFFMGHDRGVQEVYDHNSEFHSELFRNAYERIGAYLSLDASKVDEAKITEEARSKTLLEMDRRLKERDSVIESLSQRLEGYQTQMRGISKLSDEEVEAVRQLIARKG